MDNSNNQQQQQHHSPNQSQTHHHHPNTIIISNGHSHHIQPNHQQQQHHQLHNNVAHQNSQLIVHAGWLMKSPPEKRIWKTKWRRRWFVLKLSGHIPGQYVLEYYVDQSCKKMKGSIDLDQCEQVDAGLQLEIRKENFEFMFDLRTSKRVYYLVASTEEEMNKWVECICSVCGLKMEAVQNELSLLPPMEGVLSHEERYSPQPSHYAALQAPTPTPPPSVPPSASHSTQSSVTNLNEPSLNYIPISECYTGRANEPTEDSSPPPPRPPKPRALQLGGKSQSSLALWPQAATEQQQQQPQQAPQQPQTTSVPAVPPPSHSSSTLRHTNTLDTRRSSQKMPSQSILVNDRPLYLNHSTSTLPNPNHNPAANHQYEFCNSNVAGIVVVNQNGNGFEAPPLVNRDLKPHRRNAPGGRSMDSSPFGSHSARHTLPRPPPSYPLRGDDSRKSFNQHHTTTSSNLHHNSGNHFFSQPGNEKLVKLPPSFMSHNYASSGNRDSSNSEIQYLDLDLDSSESTNSQSPRTPFNLDPSNSAAAAAAANASSSSNANNTSDISSSNTWNIPPNHHHHSDHHHLSNHHNNNNNNNNASTPNANLIASPNGGATGANQPAVAQHCNSSSTVYKKVDFVKTKAFNDMRVNVDFYRNAQ